MLLAKLYLNNQVYTGTAPDFTDGIGKWTETIALCDEIIGSGKYKLADDFWKLYMAFNESYCDQTETILPIIYNMTAGLKVQLLNESRTSAFTVEPSDAPLYRRFNKAILGEDEKDGPDSLLFVEKYRKEYLMDEGNSSFTDEFVDYLGIWSKEKAENKLAMRIDTAWLNRGAGNVKPQYLISVAVTIRRYRNDSL